MQKPEGKGKKGLQRKTKDRKLGQDIGGDARDLTEDELRQIEEKQRNDDANLAAELFGVDDDNDDILADLNFDPNNESDFVELAKAIYKTVSKAKTQNYVVAFYKTLLDECSANFTHKDFDKVATKAKTLATQKKQEKNAKNKTKKGGKKKGKINIKVGHDMTDKTKKNADYDMFDFDDSDGGENPVVVQEDDDDDFM